MTFAEVGALFAQAGGGGGGGDGGDAAAAIGMMACSSVVAVAAIVLNILFLLTLYRALKECAPENRTMEPGHVWLTFIPLVGIIFLIMALFKVPDSLQNEYRDRGLREDGDFGKNLAIWYIVTAFVCGLVSPILWIMYWVKIHGYVKTLQERPGRGEYEDDRPSKRLRDDEDDNRDDEDDRPSKRRRRDDD